MHKSPSTFTPAHCPHWAVFARRDRSPRLGTGPRELPSGARVREPVSPRETGPRETGPHLGDWSLSARFSGLSQFLALLAGTTFGNRSLPARDRLHHATPLHPARGTGLSPAETGPREQHQPNNAICLICSRGLNSKALFVLWTFSTPTKGILSTISRSWMKYNPRISRIHFLTIRLLCCALTVYVTPRDRCQFGPTRARQTDAERTEFPLSAQGSSRVQIQTRNALAETYTNGLHEGKQ